MPGTGTRIRFSGGHGGSYWDDTAYVAGQAGLIGGVERFIIGQYFGIGSFTRVACSVSTVLAGLLAAGMLAAGARYWERQTWFRPMDRFWQFRDDFTEDWGQAEGVSIPIWSSGQGATFHLDQPREDTLTAQEVYLQVNPAVVSVLVGLDDETAAIGTGVVFSLLRGRSGKDG